MNRRIIHVKQNSKDWVEWRGRGLGASDAPVIMGVSPWSTRFKLWAEKTGILSRTEPNVFQAQAMKRGHDLEPKARALYEAKVGKKFPATSFEHPTYPYLRASLDGFNADLNMNLEIKCPGQVDHATAIKGCVPEKYMPQLQMQMLVSGAMLTDYVSWDGKGEILVIPVRRDDVYQERLLQELISFWSMIQTKTPPAMKKEEVLSVLAIFKMDLERLGKSFNTLALVCEAISKGENNDA